jgi:hypothetical protein
MPPFVSSPAKDLLRSTFDHEFIRRRVNAGVAERAYLGLPGERLLDVLEWQDCIDKAACVHRDKDGLDAMRGAASDAHVDSRCEFYRGTIEGVLTTGADEDNQRLADRPYHIVNLDYEGGLIQDRSANRLECIRPLFDMQADHRVDFVLLLTLGPRGKPGEFLGRALDQVGKTLAGYNIDASENIRWYRDQPDTPHLWKVFVPYAFETRARAFRYELVAWQSFFYLGTNDVPMMHFAMSYRYALNDLVPESINLAQLLTSRLSRVTDKIRPDPIRPPPLVYR